MGCRYNLEYTGSVSSARTVAITEVLKGNASLEVSRYLKNHFLEFLFDEIRYHYIVNVSEVNDVTIMILCSHKLLYSIVLLIKLKVTPARVNRSMASKVLSVSNRKNGDVCPKIVISHLF